ncbi:VWA domain-containing protein [Luteimonas sp. A649]
MTLPLTELQFLRPAWLIALLLLPLLAWTWRQRARRRSAWRTAVDPHLLPRLLASRGTGRGMGLAGAAALVGLALAILALAGPSWRSVPQPLQRGGGALVIALDLSSATLANDLPPSRLLQARAKLGELLRAHAGDVALVAYADDAFVVSPVTADAANVAVFLDALAPELMPVDGQDSGRAIDLARDLLAGAGHARGQILLLTAEPGQGGTRAAARAAADGYQVSVLAMGTDAGAGYRERDGGIHRSALDSAGLWELAAAGGGRVHDWNAPAAQIVDTPGGDAAATATGNTAKAGEVLEDGGYWLLPLAMLLLLAVFRRGGVLAALALCLVLPVQPAFAVDDQPPQASPWRRADQAMHARSVEAESAYRAGEFEAAARGFADVPGADAAYNRGNALARAGRYREALAAYDEALAETPGMADAAANRAAVEAAMQRQQPPAGGGRGGDAPPDGGQGGAPGPDDGKRGEQGQGEPDADPGREPGEEAPEDPSPDPADAGTDSADPPAADDADADAQARQQAADEAQREAMQRALDAGAAREGAGQAGDGTETQVQAESTAAREREEANAAWLRRIPDDPGALLRARFRSEHLRRRAGER